MMDETKSPTNPRVPPPDAAAVEYRPRMPRDYNPPIGLIGAGGITHLHLSAYRAMGLKVVAIADIDEGNAIKKRDEFFPHAEVHTSHQQLLERPDIEVVDVATHVNVRPAILWDALKSGRHVLSQKPFVEDLAEGRALVEFAREKNLRLAVNQNGRWAPHFSFLRQAVAKGIIGKVNFVNATCLWDHLWIKGTAFDRMKHMLFYDFAIHWFDICGCLMSGERPGSVFASLLKFSGQAYQPPAVGSVILNYEDAQACLQFHGHVPFGGEDSITVCGTEGVLRSRGTGLADHPAVELETQDGKTTVELAGSWFLEGFQGTMAELLCAIEENREPDHSGASNLLSLETCFAVLRSADTGLPVVPGAVRRAEAGQG